MNHSLKPWNTFGIQRNANEIVRVDNAQQLLDAWQSATEKDEPVLILGEGSNVLFLDDFAGTVIVNRIMGIDVEERADSWHLHVGAGENWHHLVQYTLEKGWQGWKTSPSFRVARDRLQFKNIGAYGIELKHVCEYVDCIELATGSARRLTAEQCRFGYRDSIFKHEYQDRYVIVAVGLRLAKQWKPILTYGDLARLDPATVTPHEVFDSVCHMRMTKLPDPKVNGNAGSFFKNPVISGEDAKAFLAGWPTAPHYPQADGSVKLAAGWLIDRCELKGTTVGALPFTVSRRWC